MDTKELLLSESNEMISGIYERIQSLESLDLKSLDKNRTILLIVDINKGFAKAGAGNQERRNSGIPAFLFSRKDIYRRTHL